MSLLLNKFLDFRFIITCKKERKKKKNRKILTPVAKPIYYWTLFPPGSLLCRLYLLCQYSTANCPLLYGQIGVASSWSPTIKPRYTRSIRVKRHFRFKTFVCFIVCQFVTLSSNDLPTLPPLQPFFVFGLMFFAFLHFHRVQT